jgi:hypothetical protein
MPSPTVVRAALALCLVSTACTPGSGTLGSGTAAAPAQSAGADRTASNAINFHVLDYVGWNNHDIDVFRRLHTADVKVQNGAYKTEGIDQHVAALQPYWTPDALVTSHNPIVAEGDWTCMVGNLAGGTSKMVTVAKWRDGAVSEEYILNNLLAPGAARPAMSGSPVATITNRSAEMKRQVGAELGWSCSMEQTADGKLVISVSKAGGTAAQRMVFVQ